MTNFKINDIPTETLGITILEGVYSELLKLPKPKDTLVNNWKDEHGTERDLAARVYESAVINIPVLLIGSTVADFVAKRTAFNAMMLNGRFNLKCLDINRQFDLVYTDTTNFKGDDYYASFTLVCADDFPQLNTPIV
ncbi:hypothetical protein [Pedobacter arcticus]|uniref:hypothetical protein n=1 Tax=Pedobacter arcticus TaxID=752140 RepID=UPI000310280F|nr:hypothetical protein [Pedobacter arcticus]